MSTMYRLAIPAICLGAALASYLVSFQTGAGVFFALAVVFEVVAWIVPRRRERQTTYVTSDRR
jgi:membrane protein implicated in regulation of membrane protease activity